MDNVSDQKAKLFYDIEEESIWHIQNAINNMDRLGLPHSELVKALIPNINQLRGYWVMTG